MSSEIEATFVEVDHDKLRSVLKSIGARLVYPSFLMQRSVWDYPDLRLDKQRAWVRVRREADKITMAFKQRHGLTIDSMDEVEVVIDNYDSACSFLESLGLKVKSRVESKREAWQFESCEITLDEWPWIPPYVEIEGPNEETVKSVAEKLGFSWNDAIFDSIDGVYLRYYDVTRTEISSTDMSFIEVPEWLEGRRR
jgi:adenylate cyclase class 2